LKNISQTVPSTTPSLTSPSRIDQHHTSVAPLSLAGLRLVPFPGALHEKLHARAGKLALLVAILLPAAAHPVVVGLGGSLLERPHESGVPDPVHPLHVFVDPKRLAPQDNYDPEQKAGTTGSHVSLAPSHGSGCTLFQTWQNSSSS